MSSWTDNYKRYDPQKEGFGNRHNWKKAFKIRLTPEEMKTIFEEEDPYRILGVSRMASKETIRDAYRKLVKQWHPDLHPEDSEICNRMMKKINEAYTILC